MMTFAKFQPPFDDPWLVQAFAQRSADVVRRCIDQWGGEIVRDWYWCIWNEPKLREGIAAAYADFLASGTGRGRARLKAEA